MFPCQATDCSQSALQHSHRLKEEEGAKGTRLQRPKLGLLELSRVKEVDLAFRRRRRKKCDEKNHVTYVALESKYQLSDPNKNSEFGWTPKLFTQTLWIIYIIRVMYMGFTSTPKICINHQFRGPDADPCHWIKGRTVTMALIQWSTSLIFNPNVWPYI